MMRNASQRTTLYLLGATVLCALLLLSACGGDDNSSDGPTALSDSAAATDSTSSDSLPAAPSDSPSDTTAVTTDDPTNGPGTCHDLFSDDEVATLFGEPAVLDIEDVLDMAELNESIGLTRCAWETIDEDIDDLAGQVLTVQVYSGNPVPGENFYDPSIYEGATEIDGIGEKAFVAGEQALFAGITSAFLDGDVAGFVSYAVIALGDSEQTIATEDQIIDLLRKLHDRAT